MKESTREAGWSFRLGRVAGIEVRVHATFFMLLAWIGVSAYMGGQGAGAALAGVAFVLLVFGIVVLHELGHALTARRFGIRTRDITLLPIGGVARLDRMPDKPSQEMAVAIAGPLVNVVLAAAFYVAVLVHGDDPFRAPTELVQTPLLVRLLWVNVTLAVFNLIPAFPMDGGRVLRAALAMRLERARATEIAARVGRLLAVGFGIVGLLTNPMLVFAALFIWAGATQEAALEEARAIFAHLRVKDGMLTDLTVLAPDAVLDVAVRATLAGSQADFPVVLDGRPLGLLTRDRLVAALTAQPEATASQIMDTAVPLLDPEASLDELVRDGALLGAGKRAFVVDGRGQLIGMVTPENLGELLLFEEAKRVRRRTIKPVSST